MKLILYTTLGCHLCEQAAAIIARVQAQQLLELEVEAIDIADHDELVEQFGIRIPVVLLKHKNKDLGWPFDESELKNYLSDAG
ncbi:MAG: hypothetical protein ACJAYE_003033 [Candidatus Azotimanducaceae bacterium]|jgi:thioredoxin-like negative regulator of GroEL